MTNKSPTRYAYIIFFQFPNAVKKRRFLWHKKALCAADGADKGRDNFSRVSGNMSNELAGDAGDNFFW
jgi:hypothetical protein